MNRLFGRDRWIFDVEIFFEADVLAVELFSAAVCDLVIGLLTELEFSVPGISVLVGISLRLHSEKSAGGSSFDC